MNIFPRSIKGRLFLWFFSFSSILLITFGFFIFFKAKEVIFNAVDRTLHSKIQLITGGIHEEEDDKGKIELEMSGISGEYSVPRSGHYYKVLINGRLLEASKSLVDGNLDLTSGTLIASNEEKRERSYLSKGPAGEPVKVLVHDLEFKGSPMTVFVAESLVESLRMISLLKHSLIIAIPVSIFLGGIIGFWITKKSLNPIEIFSAKVSNINHKNLSERLAAEKQALELNRLATSFNEMLDRLQKAFEAECRLISDASHELKTPLAVIKSHCDILLQKERTAEEYIEALKTINSVSANMTNLVSDMLSLARLDSGLLASSAFVPVSLNEVLKSVISMVKVLAEKKGINMRLSIDEMLSVHGDKSRLAEAFLNLIENAVTYNKEGGAVNISARATGNNVSISIEDTGVGIKKDNLGRLFERFYRADTSRKTDGTGLGLSIAKAVIEAHSGSIEVESEQGRGSCFTVTIPSAPGRA